SPDRPRRQATVVEMDRRSAAQNPFLASYQPGVGNEFAGCRRAHGRADHRRQTRRHIQVHGPLTARDCGRHSWRNAMRSRLVVLILALATLPLVPPARAQNVLVVSVWGGNWKDTVEKVIGKA